MKQILIATGNPGKLAEIQKGFKSLGKQEFSLITLNDVRVEEKPEETGKTFCENARIKAVFYEKKTGLPTIGDDGGLVIPYLNNEPGVKSRRWPGYEATDEELINFTLKKMRRVEASPPVGWRTAYLTVCLCFYDPETNKTVFEEEKVKGRIAEKPSKKRIAGYPFRALFMVDKFNQPRQRRGKYYDELTEKEHEQVNHRLKAAKRLAKKIKIIYNLK